MVIFCHWLDSFSGSARVLGQILREYAARSGTTPTLIVGAMGNGGFLSQVPACVTQCGYAWHKNIILRAIRFFVAQLFMCIKLLRMLHHCDRSATIYVNTILPLGAVVAARVSGAKLVVHVHEGPDYWPMFYSLARKLICPAATEVIAVSQYVAGAWQEMFPKVRVIYNGVDVELAAAGRMHEPRSRTTKMFTVVMIGGVSRAKGLNNFCNLAARFDADLSIQFVLHVDDALAGSLVCKSIESAGWPSRLTLSTSSINTIVEIYKQADALVVLSEVKETFGLTLIEAMCFGVPVIAPNVGGPPEVVGRSNGGFVVCPSNLQSVETIVRSWMGRNSAWQSASVAAKHRASEFSEQKFIENIFVQVLAQPLKS